MCGIIGYTGKLEAAPVLLEGLSRLEYRGYDSAGIAILGIDGSPVVCKSSGKLSNLRGSLKDDLPSGNIGIGHTRWATHGRPTDLNAHPHMDCSGQVMVVHNGIVENYVDLKKKLTSHGHEFISQTDAECIPHLIETYLEEDYSIEEAVREASNRIHGSNAVVVMWKGDPGKLIAFRQGNAGGIVVGYGDKDMLLASDLPALLPHTRRVAYLAGGEMVSVERETVQYTLSDGTPIEKKISHAPYDDLSAVKGSYKHFMLKEIHDQPEAVMDSFRGRVSFNPFNVELNELPFSDDVIKNIDRVVFIGMGTSLHAAMVGRTWMESLARIASEVENSSEFRYRDPVIDEHTLVISISQSGETADTLAAMEEASRKGARQLTLCNYEGTQTTRIADGTVYIRAGLEIGVASTKTFVCSLMALYLLALHLGVKRGILGKERLRVLVEEMSRLPRMLGALLTDLEPYESIALQYTKYRDFLFLGRGINYPLAMEGALKLKEISYLHAEGYPAGEMKHGPISLIDENMPVVALIPQDPLYEKMLNNINEVKARGGKVIALATEGDTSLEHQVDDVIYIPEVSPFATPILLAEPMQLLAYHLAVKRGCDIDQPRNLAKSVTVE